MPLLASVGLHLLIALLLFFAADFSFHRVQPTSGAPINAVAVDAQAFRAFESHKADAARERAAARQAQLDAANEAQQRAEAAVQARAAAEAKAQAEKKAQAQAEAQARVEAQAAREQAARDQAREQASREQAVREQARAKAAVAQAEHARALRAQADAKAQAEARARVQEQAMESARAATAARENAARSERESELRRQLSDEESVSAAASSTMMQSYIASIAGKITRAWLRPATARSGIVCTIQVAQSPAGEVTEVHVTHCNGDEQVRQSVENAVYRASPLPKPPDPALFQPQLTLVFKPND